MFDFEGDGSAEIVAVSGADTYGRNGIIVIGDANDTWVPTREISNQHTYHITNGNDDDGLGDGQVREPNEENNIHAAFPITYEPSILVARPTDGDEYQVGTTLLVSGTAIGSLLTVEGFQAYPNRIVAVLVNGIAVDAFDSAGNFFLQTTILPGDNVFEVTAIDAFGQRATETVTVFGTEPAEGVVEDQLFDVSPSFREAYARTSFDEGTDLLYAQLAIENIGQYPADNPFLVGVTNIRDPQTDVPIPSISTRQTAGVKTARIPYYDFNELVSNDSLCRGTQVWLFNGDW